MEETIIWESDICGDCGFVIGGCTCGVQFECAKLEDKIRSLETALAEKEKELAKWKERIDALIQIIPAITKEALAEADCLACKEGKCKQ